MPASIPVHAAGAGNIGALNFGPGPAFSSLLPLQRKLAIGATSDPQEAEADAVAERVMRMAEPAGRLSQATAEPTLRRKCACEGSGQPCANCQEEEKKKLMRKSTGGVTPMEAPPIVHEVLRSPGQRLDAATRAFFEPRFQGSFAQVRIHDDARAASSARQVQARAYAVGHHLVFAEGQYRPDSQEGRRLIAHELSHVVQQGAEAHVRRQNDERGEGNPNSVFDRAYAAADASRWEEVAGILKDSSEGEIVAWIYPFRNEPEKISFMYLGAIGNKSVGPKSNLAQVTRATHLDFKFKEEKHRGNWSAAAEYLNGLNRDDAMRRLKPLKTEEVRSIHDGAVKNTAAGPESGAAKFSAEELAARAAKGDAAAAVAPSESAQPQTAEQRKASCAQGKPENGMIFPLRLPKGLWRIDVAPISARRDGEYILVHQPVNAVFANSYFRSETRTLPLDVFTGGIRLKPDEVVRVRLYDQEKEGKPVIRCVTGEQMLKISDATDTAVIVGIVDTALLAATVFVPGGGAAATRFAVGQVAANELGELAVQKAQVDAGIQDKVDWVGLSFDTILQLATLGFGGKLTKVVLGKLEVIPETGKFARPVLAWAIQTAISGAIFDFQALAKHVFERIRKENKESKGEKQETNYGDLIEQLALEFVKGTLFHAVLSAAAEHEGRPQEPAGAGTSTEKEPTPHPAARAQKPPAGKPKSPLVHEPTGKPVAEPELSEPASLETPVAKDQGAPPKPPAAEPSVGAKKPAQDLQTSQEKKPPLPQGANKKTLSVDEIPWADDVGLAMIELDEAAAYEQFDKWITDDPQREVAIYKDTVSGEYILVQGKERSVGMKDVLTDPSMRRKWIPIEHHHPGRSSVARLASRDDFRALMQTRPKGKAASQAVSSRIRWTDVRGKQHTTVFGYKPGEAEPYYMEFEDLDGKQVTKTFKGEPWKPGSDYEKFLAKRGVVISRGNSPAQSSESGAGEGQPATPVEEPATPSAQPAQTAAAPPEQQSEAPKAAEPKPAAAAQAAEEPDATAKPKSAPKKQSKKNPPIDSKKLLQAAGKLSAAQGAQTEASHQFYSSTERLNELDKKLPGLVENAKAAPAPASLLGEANELRGIEDMEERVARLKAIRSSKSDWSDAERKYFDTREALWEARADRDAAEEEYKQAQEGRTDANIKIPAAEQELGRASQAVADIIRKGEDGPNYTTVSKVKFDQILGEEASKALAAGTKLNTDHLVPVREIRDMINASELPRLHSQASPTVQEAIEDEYRNLGDIRSNLIRMQEEANQIMKSDRSWHEISYEEASKYGYKKEMVDRMREDENAQRQLIGERIKELAKEFAAKIQGK
jgi:hypothetical protein